MLDLKADRVALQDQQRLVLVHPDRVVAAPTCTDCGAALPQPTEPVDGVCRLCYVNRLVRRRL